MSIYINPFFFGCLIQEGAQNPFLGFPHKNGSRPVGVCQHFYGSGERIHIEILQSIEHRIVWYFWLFMRAPIREIHHSAQKLFKFRACYL